MSLKIFHIIFISLSVLLSLGFGFWAIQFAVQQNQPGYMVGGVISLLSAVALIVYGRIFLKKMKDIN